MQEAVGSKLLAIVRVPESERVRCQNPGCGHGVHAAIHIVRECGRLMVLGSTCFERRYGSVRALGLPQFSSGAAGRELTSEERAMLDTNTDLLLARFEEEERQRLQRLEELAQEQRRLAAEQEERRSGAALVVSSAPRDPLERLRALKAAYAIRTNKAPVSQTFAQRPARTPVPQSFGQRQAPEAPRLSPPPEWAHEVKQNGCFFCYAFDDGSHWVLYPLKTGDYALRPWPTAEEGWDEALPPSLGKPEPQSGFYRVPDRIGFLQAVSRFNIGLRNTSNPAEIQHEFDVLARKA